MASNHTGTATPTPGALAPSPAPAPGAAPVTSIPEDVDPNNVATMFAQQYPTLADYIAFLQSASRVNIPVAPGSSTGFGFGAITHSGGGTGTITPSGVSLGGQYCVVKIMSSGGLGVGSFQFSTDGGSTYGATTTIPGGGTYTDGSGIAITFAGTFTSTDTYAFRCIDAPLQMWHDPSGRARELVDHLGFLNGQVSSHREDWTLDATSAFAAASSDVYIPGNSRWKYTLGTAGVDPTLAFVVPQADALGNFNCLRFTGSTSVANLINGVRTSRPIFAALTTSRAVAWCQALIRLPANSANASYYFGFVDTGLSHFIATHARSACFRVLGTGNWYTQVQNDLALANSDTGIAPNAGAASNWQLLRVEYYGPDSQVGVALGGAVVRWLIDGQQVKILVNDANIPDSASMLVAFSQNDAGNTPADQAELGPVSYGVNWLDDPVRM